MFFYAAKIIWYLSQPSMLLLLLLAVATVLLWTRWARGGRRLVLLTLVLLAVLSLSPLGQVLTWPLENRFPRANVNQGGPITGIIVLGGSEDTHVGLARDVTALNEAGERMTETIALARRFPDARVVFSGGGARIVYEGRKESIGAEALLTAMGLPRERLLLEDRARDTYENALYTKELLQPSPKQRWLLVTSAYHMPRAMGCFREVGFPVEPWPVDYRTRGPQDWQRFFDRPSEGLRRIDIVLREWVGLVVYWVTGRIPSPLPGPAA